MAVPTFSAPIKPFPLRLFPFGPRISVDSHDGITVVWNDNSSGNLDISFLVRPTAA